MLLFLCFFLFFIVFITESHNPDPDYCVEITTPQPVKDKEWYSCPLWINICVPSPLLNCQIVDQDCFCSLKHETKCDSDCSPSDNYHGYCHCPLLTKKCHNSGFLFWRKVCSSKEDGQCYCEGNGTLLDNPFHH